MSELNETIMIGDDIEITIVDIKGEKIRIGINAPKEIPVHRKEVYQKIKEQNIEASLSKTEAVDKVGDLLRLAEPAQGYARARTLFL